MSCDRKPIYFNKFFCHYNLIAETLQFSWLGTHATGLYLADMLN